MTKEIRNELSEAKKQYDAKNYLEAYEIYERNYLEKPEEFNKWDKIFYSWSIYQLYVKDPQDENQLFESVELVTDLTRQSDLNKRPACAYTFSVFKVLDYLYKNNDYEYLLYWLDKINPTLLDSKQSEFNGRLYASRREKYFNYASKAFFECNDYEDCILISDKALRSLDRFTNNSDVWYNWRIAKSLKELDKPNEALKYLDEVSKVKHDWFIYREYAEVYFKLNQNEKALDYIVDAVLTNDPPKIKVNLFYLIYKLLNEKDPSIALQHAKLFKALKLESGASIPDEIEVLLADENDLDVDELESEIKNYWIEYKFKDQELQYGTITKILDHGKSGFIASDNGESLYFKVSEFKGKIYLLDEGLRVSFYTKKGFDKSKNVEKTNAVNINISE